MEQSTAGNGKPRLVIKRLELENFKSYAGVQHVGPFHKSFSAIIGPNGSGKSNVIDAMLFVFGKRAKQLRLNKVSELIHNSSQHRNLQQAQVSVFFEEIIDQGDESYEVVPDSQLVVSRTASRDNKSNYYVNKKKSNFKEVTDLLKAKGVDLNNNRFLILQGEVEQIAMMKPKGDDKNETGLLEYLEDIIGTDQYKQPIEEAAAKLEELNDQRQTAVHRVKRAEAERDNLEDAKNLAMQYREKDIAHVENSILLTLHNEVKCLENVEKTAAQLAKLQERIDHEAAKLDEYAIKVADITIICLKHKIEKAMQKDCEAMDKARKRATKAAENAESKLKGIECDKVTSAEKQKHVQKKIKTAEANIAAQQAKLAEYMQQAAAVEEDISAAERRLAELRADRSGAEAKLDRMKASVHDETHKVQERLSEARARLEPWTVEMQDCQNERNLNATKLQCLMDQADAGDARLQHLREQLHSATIEVQSAGDEIAALEAELSEQKALHERATAAAATARSAVEAAEQTVGEARASASGLRAMLDAERSRGVVLTALTEAQARGELSGIHGRLGDLGAIDAKYDAATSNATSALDHIVVQSVADGQAVVQYLRENNLGVASCLILDKQRHFESEMDRARATPEDCPRLFDLIKCNDRALRTAFYFAVRDTLVATDMQQARRIAYQRGDRRPCRVVTLKGELISESGTMTGGGTSVRTGKMRLGNAAPVALDATQMLADLAAAENRARQAEAQLQGAQAATAQHLAAAEASEQDARQAEAQLRKRRAEAESAALQVVQLERQIKDEQRAAEKAVQSEQERASLMAIVAQLDKQLAAIKADAADAEDAVAKVLKQLELVGGEPMRQQRDLVDSLKLEASEVEKLLAKQRGLLSQAKKSAATMTSDLDKRRQAHEQVQQELRTMLEGVENASERVAELQQVHAQLSEEACSAQKEYDSLFEELAKCKGEYGKIKQVASNLEEEYAAVQRLHENEDCKASDNAAAAANLQAHLRTLLPVDDQRANATKEEVASLDEATLHAVSLQQIQLEGEMKDLQKTVDMGAIKAYAVKERDYQEKRAALEAVTSERDSVRDQHDGLRKRRLDEFMAGFLTISLKLKEMYQMITLGGDAELELVDTMDPFSEGIVFSVRPPKKSWKNIVNLSGGEKTLSSLSLVFALHHYKPTPLYFMDEIDAALDFKNVSIVAHYVKEQTRNAQFVVISLRNNMFELADHLVGIYKTHNCTKSVAINPNDYTVGAQRPLLQQSRA